jgi:hypothetical protein
MGALFWQAKQLAKELSGSPCSIVLVIPTPNEAEESAIRESARTGIKSESWQATGVVCVVGERLHIRRVQTAPAAVAKIPPPRSASE